MTDEHLPGVYLRFRGGYPAVAAALDELGEAIDGAGPLDDRTTRLVKPAHAATEVTTEERLRQVLHQHAAGRTCPFPPRGLTQRTP